jgi:general secretion pathway protein D
MKGSRQVILATVFLLSTMSAVTASAQVSATVPLTSPIATVAKNTGRKFVLDPRVRANVTLIGQDTSNVTYDQLLTILNIYGFMAADTGGYVQVVPDAMTREEPLPLISDKDKRPDEEYVTAVLHVRSLPAGWFVPILRPLLPQQGHLAAMPCANDLVKAPKYSYPMPR